MQIHRYTCVSLCVDERSKQLQSYLTFSLSKCSKKKKKKSIFSAHIIITNLCCNEIFKASPLFSGFSSSQNSVFLLDIWASLCRICGLWLRLLWHSLLKVSIFSELNKNLIWRGRAYKSGWWHLQYFGRQSLFLENVSLAHIHWKLVLQWRSHFVEKLETWEMLQMHEYVMFWNECHFKDLMWYNTSFFLLQLLLQLSTSRCQHLPLAQVCQHCCSPTREKGDTQRR